jgi:capsular polysaccharide biosynthesis protein
MDTSQIPAIPPRPQAAPQFSQREFFMVLFLHKWTVIGSFIVLLAAIQWGLSLRQSLYVASVKFFVNRALPQQTAIRYVGRLEWEEEINSLAEMGRSQGVLSLTARRFDELRGWSDPPPERRMEIAAGLATMVEVVPVQETNIINILVRDADADTAIIIAELYGHSFLEDFQRISRESHGRAYFEEALVDVETRIRTAKDSKTQLQESAELYNWANQEISLSESVQQLSRELAKRRIERGIFEQQLKQEREYSARPDSAVLPLSLREDRLVGKLEFVVNDLRMELAALESRYTGEHRMVRLKREELASAKRELVATLSDLLAQHEARLQDMLAGEAMLEQAIAGFQAQLEHIPGDAAELEYYDDYITQQWRLYGELVTKYSDSQASVAQSLLENQILQLGPPIIGGVEGLTPRFVRVFVAPLFALVLAVAIAFMKEATTHTFQKRTELEDLTGVPVLASFRKL